LAKTTTKDKEFRAKKSKKIKNKTEPQKEQEPKKQVVQKKIEITKPKIVQSKKTKPEEIIEPVDFGYTKSNENTKKNQEKIDVVQNTTTDNIVLENEVEKALKQWVFEPIIYRDKPMPIYFYKIFHFVSKG
jgi:hypothetical protein